MADVRRSIKDLWVIISGNTVLKSSELVGTELSKNADQVLNGILYFTDKRKEAGTVPDGFHPELLTKLSTLLGLDKQRSYELFCSYLVFEYRGTHGDLKATLSSERNIPYILHEVWNFYRTERLFSLFCLKHILEHWQNTSHPYMELLDGFLESINTNEIVIKKVIEQLETVIEVEAPTRDTHGPYMTSALISQWVNYTLQEQCELLQIALLYYKDMQPKLDDIFHLLNIFQKHSFGQRHPYRHLLNDAHASSLDLISHLECFVLVESLDLDWLHRCHLESKTDHQLLKDTTKLVSLDRSISCLGGQPVHGPLLLSWLLVRSWTLPDVPVGNLGKAALKCNAFGYLSTALGHPAFLGNGVVPAKVHAIAYELVLLLVSSFEHQTLGPVKALFILAEQLLSYPALAQDFWNEGEGNGFGHMFTEAKKMFPLQAEPLLHMLAALARASEASAHKVIHYLEEVPFFVETLEQLDPEKIHSSCDRTLFQLRADRFPYGTGSVMIPRGTEGTLLESEGNSVVRWQVTVNGWQVCLCELARQRDMDEDWLQRVLHITRLLGSLLQSDPSLHDLLTHFVDAVFSILHRVARLAHPPVELLGECLRMAGVLAQRSPKRTWSLLVQSGLLPKLSARPKSAAQLAKGYLVTKSVVGQAMASQERIVGNHPVCLAFLGLLAVVSETFVETADEDFLACLVVVLQDIFPSFHQWPYTTVQDRDIVGHRCLVIFHRVLALSSAFRADAVGSCEVCVHSFLDGDAGQSLLRLIIAGEASVARAIECEGSQQSEDLLTSVRLCFSLLNRLLMLSGGSGSGSQLEQRLLVSPSQSSAACLVVSVGHFLYLRFDPRLCTLAVQLLKRIAKLYPMSLLACLGKDAEGFRDQMLLRLSKLTEDVRLKVAILQLLAVCIRTQPGLSHLFFSSATTAQSQDTSCTLSPCLEEVLKILEMKQKKSYFCPTELHYSAVEVIHTIWACHQLRAMELLRKHLSFWDLVCFPIVGKSVASQDPRLVALILKTLALELYLSKNEPDNNVKSVFEKVQKEGLLKEWSKLVNSSLPQHAEMVASASFGNNSETSNTVADTFMLLSSWRDLCVTLAKCNHLQLTASEKDSILQDIHHSLMSDEVLENLKMSILLGELYLVLVNQWSSKTMSISSWSGSIDSLLCLLASGVTTLHPRLILVLATIAASAVKKLRLTTDNEFQPSSLNQWVKSLCDLLSYHCQKSANDMKAATQLSIQVCTTLVVLLKDVLSLSPHKSNCIPLLQEKLVIPVLGDILYFSLRVRKDNHLARAICHLFLSLAPISQMAEALQACGFLERVSPYLRGCYEGGDQGWLEVYRLLVQLTTALLHSLRHLFLQDAIAFVVLHLDRLRLCLVQVRTSPSNILEALVSCHLVYKMASLHTYWPCDQTNPLIVLMQGVCCAASAAIAYLWRPTLLQHLIEYKKGSVAQPCLEEESNQPRRQLSTEEVAHPSPKLTEARNRLLELLSVCLACCQQFSPSVAEAISDQSLDVDQWQPIVQVSFSSPSLEQDRHLTFGTLLAASHLCLKSLTKSERTQSSARSRTACPGVLHPERSLVMAVLEMSLSIVLGQAVLCRLQPSVPARDKQLLSRELSAEIDSVKMQVQRHLRRGGPASPSASRAGGPQMPLDPLSEWALVQVFIQVVDQVFK